MKYSHIRWVILGGFCALLLACQAAEPVMPSRLPALVSEGIAPVPTLDPAQLAQGEVVYDTYCAACHGVNLEGEADWRLPAEDGSFRSPPHDETGHTWHHSDRLLVESIKEGGQRLPPNLGTSKMPPFGAVLTDAEITAVLAYIKSHWPADIQAAQWEINLRDQP
jgi:mono/diheme cytochrome c family protein